MLTLINHDREPVTLSLTGQDLLAGATVTNPTLQPYAVLLLRGSPGGLMPRYCLLGHVDPARLEEYKERHRAVWPELLEALAEAGWRNYSLFLRDDGLLIGYAEADDLALAQERVARTEVNERWQASMAALFADLSDAAPDESWEIVPEVFNLEDQLAQARASGG